MCGIILATRLSVIKKLCNVKLLYDLERFYKINNLSYTYKKYLNKNSILNLIPFLKNDKKNNDKKINFILIKDIGKITSPDKFKISVKIVKKNF